MEEKNNKDVIDLRVVFRKLWDKKKLFLKVWGVTFVLACLYILPQPRTYNTQIMLAPEMGEQSSAGALSSIASSFGFDLGSVQTSDAFYPELYPELIATNEFLIDLLYTHVKTQDGAVDTTYMNYMLKHQKKNYIKYPFNWCKRKINNLLEGTPAPVNQTHKLDPIHLSKSEDNLVNKVRNNISCDVDIKTNVITISVKDQDPCVCAQIADSARMRLQEFITTYRTSKTRIDEAYYRQLTDSAQCEYNKAMKAYTQFCDAHQNMILQSYLSERDELENDMQTKLSAYNAMYAQYQAAKAKVQERTPAFTVLKAAYVPIKASAPKRMIFVAAMLFMATLCTCFYIFRKDIIAEFAGSPA